MKWDTFWLLLISLDNLALGIGISGIIHHIVEWHEAKLKAKIH